MSTYSHLAGRQYEALKSLCKSAGVTISPDLNNPKRIMLTTGYGDILGEAIYHRGRLTFARIAGQHYTCPHPGAAEDTHQAVLDAIRENTR